MCNACIPVPTHEQPLDALTDRLIDMLNQGALSLMVSIGHRTGLFDTMSELPPSTHPASHGFLFISSVTYPGSGWL
jgi:hypothetical protein